LYNDECSDDERDCLEEDHGGEEGIVASSDAVGDEWTVMIESCHASGHQSERECERVSASMEAPRAGGRTIPVAELAMLGTKRPNDLTRGAEAQAVLGGMLDLSG